MAKAVKKLDVMKTSSAVKKTKSAPVTKVVRAKTMPSEVDISINLSASKTSRFKSGTPSTSNIPKEIAVPQKLSFFNVPKNRKKK